MTSLCADVVGGAGAGRQFNRSKF